MRPVQVVVVLILAELSMPLVDDHRAVEEFAADGAEEALGNRRWPAALAPASGDELAVPAQSCCRCDEQPETSGREE